MKPDSERKKYHKEKLHKRKKRLHVHLSKDLRAKVKAKKRSLLVRKGDTVKVMRGPNKGKQAKVSRVSTLKRKVYVEGIVQRTLRGREMPLPLEPSNLMLVGLESTKERRELFSEDIFKKKEAPKAAPKEKAEAAPEKEAPKKDEPKKEPPKKEEAERPEPKSAAPAPAKKEEPKAEAPKPPEAPKR